MTEVSKLARMFDQQKITRRQFVTQLAALGVTTAVIPSFLTPKAFAASPKNGGHFKMGMAGGNTGHSNSWPCCSHR